MFDDLVWWYFTSLFVDGLLLFCCWGWDIFISEKIDGVVAEVTVAEEEDVSLSVLSCCGNPSFNLQPSEQ